MSDKRWYATREELGDMARDYARRNPEAATRTLETAEMARKGRFRVEFSMLADRWVDLGEPVDWLANPSEDPEFTWILNRHWHMREMGRAYLLSGEEGLAEACKEQLASWIRRIPAPAGPDYREAVFFQKRGPWRLLETGLRPQSWIFAAVCMEEVWERDPGFMTLFRSALAEHADYLSAYLGDPDINHATMHMQGLFTIGVYLEEHPRSPYWRQLAKERLELCLSRQFGADGVQNELAPHYHNVSIECFALPYRLAELAGDPFPAAYGEALARMARFTACTIRPDGRTSAFSDSDSTVWGPEKLALLGEVLGRPDYRAAGCMSAELSWLFPGSGGDAAGGNGAERGSGVVLEAREEGALHAFPEAGYYILRGPEHYLMFDAAPLGGAHGHADALHFEWFCKGRAVFLDNGRYTYEEGEARRSFKGTLAHNTVTVDGLDQTEYVSSQAWSAREAKVRLHKAFREGNRTFLDASHDGYARLDTPLEHRRFLVLDEMQGRLVVVDWLLGQGTHRLVQSFHLHRDTRIRGGSHSQERSLELDLEGSGERLGLRWFSGGGCGELRMDEATGERSDRYGFKETVPVLRASARMEGSTGLVCCIAPDGWSCAGAVADPETLTVRLTWRHPELGTEFWTLDTAGVRLERR
ncbi:alginate lyase family protein [Gorillibacterium sp. sgz5001074]|uniref:alginate lyase family protein n=1 Tax=Gorillibacterium sp. sgz5001074 TaxID=3446695 RepID=UPI003F676B38